MQQGSEGGGAVGLGMLPAALSILSLSFPIVAPSLPAQGRHACNRPSG
jgi:hypothetical protein